MQQLVGSHHGQALEVGRYVDHNGEQAVKEGLQSLVTTGDDFVEYLSKQKEGWRELPTSSRLSQDENVTPSPQG